MPAFLDARDLRFLIGSGIVMVVLLAITYAIAPPRKQQSLGYPSSYSAEWAGAKAAYLLLESNGYNVERWEKSPEDLPAGTGGAVLVFAEPSLTGSASERAAIRRFVSSGGRILAMGAGAGSLAPDMDASEAEQWDPKPLTYSAVLPSPLTRDAPEISLISPDSFTSSTHPWLALYRKDDEVGAVTYSVGKGEVIWWASASPLSNGSIRDKGNLAFFLDCIGPPSDARIYWDEYFHGSRASLISYFETGPLPWAGAQIALAFVAMVFTFSRRSGPMRLPATESRLSPLEFVDTLGDLYGSAHASPAAVGVAYRRFRFALSRKIATPAKMKLPEICRIASARFRWPEDALLDTLARSERAMRNINLDEKEALYLVRQLHEYSARLEPKGRTDQEIPAWR